MRPNNTESLRLESNADSAPPLSGGWNAAVWSSVVLAYCIPAIMYAFYFPMWGNLPTWDQWHLAPIWDAYYSGGDFWPMMFQPYAGHLNIIPRFVFFGLVIMSHWEVRCEMTLSFIVAAGTLTFFIRALAAEDRRLLVLSAPLSAQVFSALQFENFMSGYPLGQNISQLGATAAIYYVTRKGAQARHILFAAVGAFVATFSWGAGLVAWPLVVLGLCCQRPIRVRWILWVLLATAGTAVVVGAGASARPPLDLRVVANFFLVLLGKPVAFVGFPGAEQCAVAGVILVLVTTLVFAVAIAAGLWQSVFRWGMFALLALGSAVLISLGRFESGLGQALSSHYVTACYPLVVSLIVTVGVLLILGWRRLGAALIGTPALCGLAALVSVSLTQFLSTAVQTIPVLQGWARELPPFEARIVAGTATDAEIHHLTHPDADLVRKGIAILRRHRLAIFSYPSRLQSEPEKTETKAAQPSATVPADDSVVEPHAKQTTAPVQTDPYTWTEFASANGISPIGRH